MEVHFTPEQENQLSQIASYTGTNPEYVVIDAVTRLLQQNAEFHAGVRRGIEQAERGELIDHQEVKDHMTRLLRP